MSVLGNRAAAEFARLVDSGATSGSGLALVAQLRTAGAALDVSVGPRPEFRDALRKRLLAVATVSGAAAGSADAAPARALPAAVSWRRRSSTVAAGALASVVAVSGVAVAGSQSLPGDPFYGVKRTTEALQLQLADGEVEKGTRHLDFAATRLREVRGLTLGRDAVDTGPALGPTAMAGVALRSGEQPLAAGTALGADVADRVRSTLADMDDQTREGTQLLTAAYRSSQAAEPLQALSRFATRQSAGLQQLLPALPRGTQPRARQSLALLTDVEETTAELLEIGACGASCDPSTAAPTAPVAPVVPGSPAPTPVASGDCQCPAPGAAPDPRPTVDPTPQPGRTPEPEPTPTRTPDPEPTAATPSPTPSQDPLPLPSLPVPVPSLPAPVPTLTLLPEPVQSVLDPVPAVSGKVSSGGGSAPAPAPEPAPAAVPQLAPLPPRP